MEESHRADRQIAIWLFVVCGAIFIMLVIGGATRLTHSGLSMMTWDPLMGWIPPLNEEQWLESFAHYKKIPEFYQLNPNMDLQGYKQIFLLEYVHRVWGRLIGLIFLLPFLWFLWKGKIRKSLRPQMIGMFILGGMQGVLGWYMVSSGFNSPLVSQYRLTAHLTMAFIIYGYIFWVALGLYRPHATASPQLSSLRRWSRIVTVFVMATVMAGGLVAGLKAGFTYNTFPLMEGRFVPEGYAMLTPWYLNLTENIAAVQFNHRTLAELTLLLVVILWWKARQADMPHQVRLGFHLLLGMGVIQLILGISTLLLVVPTWLGVMHQGGALILFTLALNAVHLVRLKTSP